MNYLVMSYIISVVSSHFLRVEHLNSMFKRLKKENKRFDSKVKNEFDRYIISWVNAIPFINVLVSLYDFLEFFAFDEEYLKAWDEKKVLVDMSDEELEIYKDNDSFFSMMKIFKKDLKKQRDNIVVFGIPFGEDGIIVINLISLIDKEMIDVVEVRGKFKNVGKNLICRYAYEYLVAENLIDGKTNKVNVDFVNKIIDRYYEKDVVDEEIIEDKKCYIDKNDVVEPVLEENHDLNETNEEDKFTIKSDADKLLEGKNYFVFADNLGNKFYFDRDEYNEGRVKLLYYDGIIRTYNERDKKNYVVCMVLNLLSFVDKINNELLSDSSNIIISDDDGNAYYIDKQEYKKGNLVVTRVTGPITNDENSREYITQFLETLCNLCKLNGYYYDDRYDNMLKKFIRRR